MFIKGVCIIYRLYITYYIYIYIHTYNICIYIYTYEQYIYIYIYSMFKIQRNLHDETSCFTNHFLPFQFPIQRRQVVKAAEAQADAAQLQGEGIARQRRAIIDGLRWGGSTWKPTEPRRIHEKRKRGFIGEGGFIGPNKFVI